MLKLVPARFFGALFCAAVAAMALPAASHANDDQSADAPAGMDDVEIVPPNSGDEGPARGASGPAPSAKAAGNANGNAKPADNDNASKQAARDAAKRALFGDPKKDSDKPNPLLDVRGADYYDRRAQELLRSDGKQKKIELHPLMQAHPDSFVVVCTGGCATGRGAEIVSMLPKPPAAQSPASSPNSQNGGNVISCVAGCGANGNISIASTPSDPGYATVGEWMTTVAKVPAGAEAPAPKAAGSGDWMDKINQDRASQQKATPAPAEATAQAPAPVQAPATVEAKSEAPAAAKTAEPKPAAPAVAEAPKAATPVESKPTAMADAKPATPPAAPIVEAKPAPVVTAEMKPAPVAETKPAPSVTVEAKPTPAAPATVATPPVTTPVIAQEAKPAEAMPAKPIVVAGEAKPAAPSPAAAPPAEAKATTPEQKSATPPATQMAALETPKAPVAAPIAKPAEAKPAPASGPLFNESAKASTPTPAAAAPKAVTPPAAAEEKPAAGSPSLFKDSAKVAATAPEAKPATSPAASAEQKPAPGTTSLFKDQTKVAAVAPPAAAKPEAAIPPKQKDGVISVLSEDKDMNAAISKARGALSSFWKSYNAPAAGEAEHALKVAVAGNGTTEHFWLTRIKRDGDKISGVISNQPQSVKTVKVGQRYEFTEDMISDWTFKRNGKLVGNETMRVLLPRMPEEQAAVYRQMYETP